MDVQKYQLDPVPRTVTLEDPQDDIYLSVKVGNAQIGGNKVTSNNKLIAKGDISAPTLLGKAGDYTNSEIEIETNVLDVNNLTNSCVITTTFQNQDNKILFSKIDNGNAPQNGVASFLGKYVLKSIAIIMFCLWSFNHSVFAQATNQTIEFKNLKTPSSPGFILLDQTPSSIEKPSTPQGLGLSLLGFQQNGGAIEFAPFWLRDHANLTNEEMYNKKMPICENAAVSLASIKKDSSTYLAGGIRTRLFQKYSKEFIEKLDSTRKAIIDALAEGDFSTVENLRNKYETLTGNPVLSVDFAAAIAGGSKTNSYEDFELNRWAAWLSINCKLKGDNSYLTTLVRYINNEKYAGYDEKSDLLDVGLRMNYDMSKFSVSLEYLQRLNLTSETYDDFRVAAIGSYQISDDLYITSTFGKNFTDVNNIIALAGVNFGYSKKKLKAY